MAPARETDPVYSGTATYDDDTGQDVSQDVVTADGGLLGDVRWHLSFFLKGFRDAFGFLDAFVDIYASPKMRRNALLCFTFNGMLFLGSILIYQYGVLKLLDVAQRRVWSWTSALVADERADDVDAVALAHLKERLDPVMDAIYYALWVYPCYGFSFLFSAQWYQNIANDMFTPKGNGRPSHSAPPAPDLKLKVADNWYRIILVLVFLLEVLACSLVPIIGQPLSFVLLCWLYAYYSFEYNWLHLNWGVQRCFEYFENRWAYFMGFGFPVATTTVLFPQVIGGGLFALLFPMYIVMASKAKPGPFAAERQRHARASYLPERIRVFKVVDRVSTKLVATLMLRFQPSEATSRPTDRRPAAPAASPSRTSPLTARPRPPVSGA